jgi:hypothetical protein
MVFLFFLFSFPGTYNSLHRELVVVEGACPLSSSSPPLSPVGAPTPPAARRNIILGTASTPLLKDELLYHSARRQEKYNYGYSFHSPLKG